MKSKYMYNKTCSGKMQKDVLNIFAAKIVIGGVTSGK